MGIVSACLPSLRPLFKKIFTGTYKGPSFRNLSNNATKSLPPPDFSTSGTFSIKPHHMWSRNGGRGDGMMLGSNGTDDQGDLQSFTRLEELDGPWGHNVHVQGGRGDSRSQSPAGGGGGGGFTNDKGAARMGSTGRGAVTYGGGSDQISLEEMQLPSRSIKVKTEVTLISTQRLDYRDHLF